MSDERLVPCPYCGKETPFVSTNPHRPFCSERCQLLDLGKWSAEKFRIPGEDAPGNEDVNKKQDPDGEVPDRESSGRLN